MRLQVTRYSIQIIPEGPQDEAFLEEVIGLREDKSTAAVIRENAFGLSCWAYAEIRRRENT